MVEACEKNDFAASTRTFLFFWGVPIAAIVLASFLTPPTSILVRASALFWAGVGACRKRLSLWPLALLHHRTAAPTRGIGHPARRIR